MPAKNPQSAVRPRLSYQQQAAPKPATLTPQQALQIFQQSANDDQQLPVDFQLRPQAVYFLTNTAQLKSLDASKAPMNKVDLRAHLCEAG
jgi:hypothetical protein